MASAAATSCEVPVGIRPSPYSSRRSVSDETASRQPHGVVEDRPAVAATAASLGHHIRADTTRQGDLTARSQPVHTQLRICDAFASVTSSLCVNYISQQYRFRKLSDICRRRTRQCHCEETINLYYYVFGVMRVCAYVCVYLPYSRPNGLAKQNETGTRIHLDLILGK